MGKMAIIKVLPGSPTAIQSAVNAANPGDVIVVHDGIYHEDVTITKNNIRIIAKQTHLATLDGENNRTQAFLLNDVTGVEILGFKIQRYRTNGIRITGGADIGGANRIVGNLVQDILSGDGIRTGTNSNLFWKNEVKRASISGIRVEPGNSNWIIENILHHTNNNGVILSGANNTLFNNRIYQNAFSPLFAGTSESPNTLVLNNKMFDNGNSVFIRRAGNWVIVDNEIQTSTGDGVQLDEATATNTFIAENEIERNAQSGININSNFNIVEENKIERNKNNGLFIQPNRTGNLVFRNEFNDNKPNNIEDLGTDNNFLANEFKNKRG